MNTTNDKGKNYTEQHVLQKIQKYCAYQERSVYEVKEKLKKFNLSKGQIKKVISMLVEGDFLNDERFARAFVRGKFRMKNWGRKKIYFELKKRNINDQIIKKSFEEIEDKEYKELIRKMIHKKWSCINERDLMKRRSKLGKFIISKGFEDELVWEILLNKTYYTDS